MSTKNYTFEHINTDEQRARLKTFAGTFDHEIKTWRWPIAAMKENDRWFGYAQFVTCPIVFFAWHTDPNICSPRDVASMGPRFQGWSDIQHGYALAAAPIDKTNFTTNVMEKHLGVKSMGLQLYERWAI